MPVNWRQFFVTTTTTIFWRRQKRLNFKPLHTTLSFFYFVLTINVIAESKRRTFAVHTIFPNWEHQRRYGKLFFFLLKTEHQFFAILCKSFVTYVDCFNLFSVNYYLWCIKHYWLICFTLSLLLLWWILMHS